MNQLRSLKKLSPTTLMLIIVGLAFLIRLILIAFNWPVMNSDEANMGLVGLHVAFKGEHPIFFYGLPYMGPLEGYVAAPFFRLFGASLVTLRIGLLLMYAAFLISTYYLVRLLYTERFALACVALLSFGSPEIILRQIRAVGEYPEMLMFAALIMLLAAWLALSQPPPAPEQPRRTRQRRLLVYALLGLCSGLAIWVDFLILAFVGAACLLLLICRWREVRGLAGLLFCAGLILGALPLILYNFSAPPGQDSLSVLLWLHRAGSQEAAALHLPIWYRLIGTVQVSLPLATGAYPRCTLATEPFFGSPDLATLPCTLFNSAWGLGFLLLGLIATISVGLAIWRQRYALRESLPQEKRLDFVRSCARMMLLIAGFLTLAQYLSSDIPAAFPETSARYLTGLLNIAPAVLWPLWSNASRLSFASSAPRRLHWRPLLATGLLGAICLVFALGTLGALRDIPNASAAYQQETALLQHLENSGATRVYSEYWTCNRLSFHSQERVICSVLDDQLKPGFDRYAPYRAIVNAEPHAAYVFPLDSPQAHLLAQTMTGTAYQRTTFENYVIYQYP